MTSPFKLTPEQESRERELSTPTATIGTHPAVILRIRFNGSTYMQMNSDHLHYVAQVGGHPMDDGWAEVLRTIGGLTIEAQATRLPNDYPDPDPDPDDQADDDDPETCPATGRQLGNVATVDGRWVCCGGRYPDHATPTDPGSSQA